MTIRLKRAYDDAVASDGFRILVDRLWPRGVSKERAAIDLWAKDVAPSPDLRRAWHAADDAEWDTYAVQYRHELEQNPALDALLQTIAEHDTVTIVYASANPERNHARVLLEYLV